MNKNPTNMLTQTQIMDALNRRHSPEKQRLLSEGHVAIAGLGGLGSNVACALARIGVGHLHLIDVDVVDQSISGYPHRLHPGNQRKSPGTFCRCPHRL